MPKAEHRKFPLEFQKLFAGDHSCVRVFSLLLKQDRGHLIDRFYDSDMNDKYLAIVRSDSDQSLRDNLTSITHRDEVDRIIKDFHQDKWSYCPLELTLHMDRNLQGTRVIPPFCHKIKLGDKGGTASIYWVAIQKKLISDNDLKGALQDSLYKDEKYGECYQMVLKSYCGNKKMEFELEKEAFSGLQSNDRVPIVRYLGCYTHDYGEGYDMGKTFNLLLEYGERDLYQSWADETNVPPVRANEILRFWNSLFKVADAIRHVHHLEVPRGKNGPLRYHGWHADIKPDNILIIRGQRKLADFGFSSFTLVAKRQDGSVPTELIRGFTDTYGAPEVSRMKRPDGTLSGVTQSIDTWSFGCVLSVAATWVVLGFQGVRQYEQLRQLSPTNIKDGKAYDRFHNGFQALPEIRKWHDYLRGHVRPSDTTTALVLNLIELKMLQTDPSCRLELEELCEQLTELSDIAKHKIKNLKKNSGDTDPVVLKALLKIEEEAQNQRSSEPKSTPLQQQSVVVTDANTPNPRPRASMQIQKELIIKSKLLGQTAYRKEILEKELIPNRIIKEENERFMTGAHNGATTDSPTDAGPSVQMLSVDRQAKPRNPNVEQPSNQASNAAVQTTNGQRFGLSDALRSSPESVRSNRQTMVVPDLLLARHSTNPAPPIMVSSLSPQIEKHSARRPENPSSMFTYRTDDPDTSAASGFHTPTRHIADNSADFRTPPTTENIQYPQPHPDITTQLLCPSPRHSHFGNGRVYDPRNVGLAQAEGPLNPSPRITISEHAGSVAPKLTADTLYAVNNTTEKQTVDLEHRHVASYSGPRATLPIPASVYDLPFDICRKRRELDEEVSSGFAKLKGKFGFETRVKDTNLVQTFSEPREIIFVVDNGWTMFEHWPLVMFVAETLAKNAAGLDKSGFDLKLTVDGHTHDKRGLKRDSGRQTLKKVLNAAWPDNNQNENSLTDMAHVFANIFKEWKRDGQRATTLLVLTDAVWSKTEASALHKTILDIARQDQNHAGQRHFSIQFVRVGNSSVEEEKLQWLDDKLCAEHNLRDIIDHCSWRATVDKMFKGSIEGWHDQKDAEEVPLTYFYQGLLALFKAFNESSDTLLSPTRLQRTPSQMSNRSSGSSSRWRDSALPERTESWRSHSRAAFSA
ncbi:hypothetical protein EJ02DRAFT_454596 [Clathrospora elynae]|uniref:Protein kinase domain-containing protein n=1 Tax=Clathrospora elynae TaxID=706981 RepID=A0A6A5SPU0_9PLEO|nr:hypothetical protein EJ02DRAFT_454596 [Clathrospora elynae]